MLSMPSVGIVDIVDEARMSPRNKPCSNGGQSWTGAMLGHRHILRMRYNRSLPPIRFPAVL